MYSFSAVKMSKSSKSVTISETSTATKQQHSPSSQDTPHTNPTHHGLRSNTSSSSLNGSAQRAPPGRSDSGCSANGRVPSIPSSANHGLEMVCPLSPTGGISIKATRPPAEGNEEVCVCVCLCVCACLCFYIHIHLNQHTLTRSHCLSIVHTAVCNMSHI